MKKYLGPFLIMSLVLICGFLLDRSCNYDAEIANWKAQYETAKKDADEANAASLAQIADLEEEQATLRGMVDSANTIIASKDSTIVGLRAKVKTADAATAALRNEVQPVLDANPKVAELVASLDAGIALRDNLIVEQQDLILQLKDRVALGDARFANQVAISDEWKSMYDREHALRLNCEAGLALYEKRAKSSRLWTAVGKYGLPVAAAVGYVIAK